MQWKTLMSPVRQGRSASPSEASRTTFQRDYDRIVFSSAFRRLHDKTQVFPLPDNDHVHSRLTHSLEVSCVGRSLGTMAGELILEDRSDLHLDPRDFGDVVAAACLAHDIGNPPFGHAGEDAIGSWFTANPEVLDRLSPVECEDLTRFEGNAQGFRVLTRLQIPQNPGLQLTHATLAAFTKYPHGATAPAKKHGYFNAEGSVFQEVAVGVGLDEIGSGQWCRHPLAYLVEAADDICYSILDLEDGFHLDKVSFDEAFDHLAAIASVSDRYRAPERDGTKNPIAYLRAKAINRLIVEVVDAFKSRQRALLEGEPTKGLASTIPSAAALERIASLTRAKCYRARSVLEVELAGYEVLHGLLGDLVLAALAERPSPRQRRALELLPEAPAGTPYQRILTVTDYLSGMTDSFAVALFRKTRGMDL